MVAALSPSKVVDTDGQLLDALEEGSETLQNVTDMFVPLMKNFHIFFFWEQLKTDLGFTKDYVVEESSAAPNLYDTERAGLPYDHVGMTKFESPTAPGYRLVVAALKRYSLIAPAKIAQRHSTVRKSLRAAREAEAAELLGA
jgi:protein SERAC1